MHPFFCTSSSLRHEKLIPNYSKLLNSRRKITLTATPRGSATMKVDAHVHVWDSSFPTHPKHPLPPIFGTATDLVKNMDAAGVDKALVVQPINYMFDHSYVREATRAFPSRLFGIGLANTTVSPAEACRQMEDLIKDGFRGVRINPNFTGDTFGHETVIAVAKRAEELDVPLMLFARPKHVPDLEQLILACPRTKIVLDHFAFAAPDDHRTQEAVRAIAERHSNIFIKISAWFRVSKTGWPHEDLHPFLDSLLQTVGRDRLLMGSDYPFVKEQYKYSKAFSLLDAAVKDNERIWIEGQSAKELFKL